MEITYRNTGPIGVIIMGDRPHLVNKDFTMHYELEMSQLTPNNPIINNQNSLTTQVAEELKKSFQDFPDPDYIGFLRLPILYIWR